MSSETIDALGRLAQLRTTGALTEAEFESQKRALLGTSAAHSGSVGAAPVTAAAPSKPTWLTVEAGLLAGLFIAAEYLVDAGALVFVPAGAAGSDIRFIAAGGFAIVALIAVALGWTSSSRRSMIASVLFFVWAIGELVLEVLQLGRSHTAWLTRLLIVPYALAIICAWDAVVNAWATRKATQAGSARPASRDRWGIEGWLTRHPAALSVCLAVAIGAYIGSAYYAGATEHLTPPVQTDIGSGDPQSSASSPPALVTPTVTTAPDPGPLGLPAADAALTTNAPATNLATFRNHELHPPQNPDRPTNWDEIVEQEEAQRALFYDVASRASDLITTQDTAWVRKDEADIIQQTCDNRDTDTRVAAYPALTDQFCTARGGQ